MFTRSIDKHLYDGKKEMPLPNCICNSDDITAMFISRYIFDIDRMKPDILEFRTDLLYHAHSWLVPFMIRSIRELRRHNSTTLMLASLKHLSKNQIYQLLLRTYKTYCVSRLKKNICVLIQKKNRRKRQTLHATFLPGSELLLYKYNAHTFLM